MQMVPEPAKQSADKPPKPPSQGGDFDNRTRRARRRRELIATYTNALGGDAKLTESQRIDVRKAAELVALSEDMRALALQDGPGNAASLSAMVRLESASVRAVRALGLPPPGSAAPVSSIHDHVAQRAAERANPQSAEEAD